MADPQTPVSVEQLTQAYGKRTALQEIDLHVATGEIVGLVGPNGSGKTTLLKVLAGFLRPSAGSVAVFGHEPFREQVDVMLRARFAFAPPTLFDELSPREHLEFLGFVGTDTQPRQRSREIDRALGAVDLIERGTDRVGTFSFGMRQRVLLALALLPTPDLLVLDEPTDGLDPLSVLSLRRVLARLRDEHGVAILLSSHLLSEIDELVDSMLVLRDGRALFRGKPSELKGSSACLRIRVDDRLTAKKLLEREGRRVRVVRDELELPSNSLDAQAVADLFGQAGLRLLEFREHRPSLETALMERLASGESS